MIKIPKNTSFENTNELKMLSWIRTNVSEWGQGTSSDLEFFQNINWLIENKFIKLNKISEKSQEELDYEEYLFSKYLREIKNNIFKEKRFIISSNPSQDVIKKFLRNTVNWNFEQEVKSSSLEFPDPTYEVIDEIYIITYKIYINHQPEGLPLNHKNTLESSFKFWEEQELKTYDQNAKIKFEITKLKGAKKIGPYMVPRTMSSTNSANLATPFHIKGVNYSISSACSTSSHCIGADYLYVVEKPNRWWKVKLMKGFYQAILMPLTSCERYNQA